MAADVRIAVPMGRSSFITEVRVEYHTLVVHAVPEVSPRVHRLYRLRYGPPEHFRRLWEEQHPKQPEQLELPLVIQGGSTATDLTNLEQTSLFVLTA
jgi:hypothetical protein